MMALRRGRIRLTRDVLAEEARELNRAFCVWAVERRPYVTLKAGISIDGKIATARGDSRWITGPPARARVHTLRTEVDAVAVGVGTVLQDDPALTAHGRGRNPKRVIFDSRLRLPFAARVVRREAPTWVFTTSLAPAKKRIALEKKGVSIYVVARDAQGRVSLPEAARVLAREGVAHLLVEGGGELHAGFLETGLADELLWFLAPRIIGGAEAKTAVEGRGVKTLAEAWPLKDLRVEKVGEDLCVRAKIKRTGKVYV